MFCLNLGNFNQSLTHTNMKYTKCYLEILIFDLQYSRHVYNFSTHTYIYCYIQRLKLA